MRYIKEAVFLGDVIHSIKKNLPAIQEGNRAPKNSCCERLSKYK
jgi:hypothetical protein